MSDVDLFYRGDGRPSAMALWADIDLVICPSCRQGRVQIRTNKSPGVETFRCRRCWHTWQTREVY